MNDKPESKKVLLDLNSPTIIHMIAVNAEAASVKLAKSVKNKRQRWPEYEEAWALLDECVTNFKKAAAILVASRPQGNKK